MVRTGRNRLASHWTAGFPRSGAHTCTGGFRRGRSGRGRHQLLAGVFRCRLAKALIHRQDRVEESANVVFWLNLGIGLVIVTLLLVGAPFIASFFHDERITPVVQVLSLQILLAAFSSVHTALLQKDLNFKPLFWVRLVTTAAPGLASIPLAIHGMGYWALVFGTLLGQMAQSAVLWMSSPGGRSGASIVA